MSEERSFESQRPLAQKARPLSKAKLILTALSALRLFITDPAKAEERTVQTPPAAGRVLTPEEQAADDKAYEEDLKAQEAVKKAMEELAAMRIPICSFVDNKKPMCL